MERPKPAGGEAVPADPVTMLISNLRDGIAAFNALPNGMSEDDREAAADTTYGAPLSAIECFDGAATTMEGVKEAIRFALDEAENFAGVETVPPMLRAALAFLDARDADQPWKKARRLMRELSAVLADCDEGKWEAHVLPLGEKWEANFTRALPRADDPLHALDEVERLSFQLADALSLYAEGSFQAMVLPSSVAGNGVMFASIRAWDGRHA